MAYISKEDLREIAPEIYEREFGAGTPKTPAVDTTHGRNAKTPQKPLRSRENGIPRITAGEALAIAALIIQGIVAACVFLRW